MWMYSTGSPSDFTFAGSSNLRPLFHHRNLLTLNLSIVFLVLHQLWDASKNLNVSIALEVVLNPSSRCSWRKGMQQLICNTENTAMH